MTDVFFNEDSGIKFHYIIIALLIGGFFSYLYSTKFESKKQNDPKNFILYTFICLFVSMLSLLMISSSSNLSSGDSIADLWSNKKMNVKEMHTGEPDF
jgi:hypothetical protein